MAILGAVVLIVAVVSALMLWRKQSLESFSVITFLLLCITSIQLIPYAPPSMISDRYLFLAEWPAILLVVSLIWRLKQVYRISLLLIIALSWCFQTLERPRDWRSNEAMIEADLRSFPGYYMPSMYKITHVQLKRRLYQDAAETAKKISDPEFRDLMLKLIEVDHATELAVTSGDPTKAIELLMNLERDLRQPPVQALWNSPVNHLYIRAHEVLAIEWEDITEHFPNEARLYSHPTF
jgi:hypothetical protein